MDYVAIGLQVRKARQGAHLTQVQLAERSHISASFLGHIERGTRKASMETILAIARTLDTSLDILLGFTPSHSPCDEAWGQITLAARELRALIEKASQYA